MAISTIPRATRYAALSLQEVVCRCAEGRDDDAWQEFVSRVGKPISLTVLRTASLWGEPSPALVEDLVQVTYLKLWEDGCRRLRDFAVEHPEAILGYVKKIATNAAHDHFKHRRSQSAGGDHTHLSTTDVDVEAGQEIHGSQARLDFEIFVAEVDGYLKRCSTGVDQERDRMIFWMYFRQGMSGKEIASLPTLQLGAKGVGSVIDRLKQCIREQVLQACANFGGESLAT